jgi:hypothetical protein
MMDRTSDDEEPELEKTPSVVMKSRTLFHYFKPTHCESQVDARLKAFYIQTKLF